MDSLYHYCSVETFVSIISNYTIRLSDIYKSNDYLETKALLSLIKGEVIRQYNETSPIHDTIVYGMENQDVIGLCVDVMINSFLSSNRYAILCACFSEKGDLLSQWRGYADDGQGVSIGFNRQCLKDICKTSKRLLLKKVHYISSDKIKPPINRTITDYSRSFLKEIESAILNGEINEILKTGHYVFSYLLQESLFLESIFYKQKSFSEESEWRIVNDGLFDKISDEWDEFFNWDITHMDSATSPMQRLFPKALQFRSTHNDIISFMDLNFKSYKDKIIDKIIIGPNCNMCKEDVEYLLSHYCYPQVDYGMDIIDKADCTYRTL